MCLCLARTRGDSSGLCSCRASAVGVDGGLDVQRVGKRSLRHSAERLASSALATLPVSGKVEGDEENQVGTDDSNTTEGSKLLACTTAHVGQPGVVGRGEVRV